MFDDPRLNLKKELLPGESLLWAGRPRQGFYLQARDGWMVPIGLFWCAFTVAALNSELASGRASPGAFFLIPHTLIGIYLLVGRFIYDAKRRAKTWYGLSDKGAIILSGIFQKNVKRIDLRKLAEITLTEHGDFRGTIRFDSDPDQDTNWLGGRRAGYNPPSFERIENPRAVYVKIMEVKKGI